MSTSEYLSGTKLVAELVTKVFPEVDQVLSHWIGEARNLPEHILCEQALASIHHKKFHSQGGSVYSLYPNADLKSTVKLIVAFQTISDYLDNLCDRAGVTEEVSFRQLHLAMFDAVNPGREIGDYYRHYPFKNDHGYLLHLVMECRTQISKLPAYGQVLKTIEKCVQLYSDLQSLKHLEKNTRENRLASWAKKYGQQYPELFWWEFSANTGSTLEIFLLFVAAIDPLLTDEEVQRIDSVYFPWVNGLHILLDYFIDAEEDHQMGDLNFTNFYDNSLQCQQRLKFFIEKSLASCALLRFPEFHKTIIRGLLAMYLSDNKALSARNKPISKKLIHKGGPGAIFFYHCSRLLRLLGKL